MLILSAFVALIVLIISDCLFKCDAAPTLNRIENNYPPYCNDEIHLYSNQELRTNITVSGNSNTVPAVYLTQLTQFINGTIVGTDIGVASKIVYDNGTTFVVRFDNDLTLTEKVTHFILNMLYDRKNVTKNFTVFLYEKKADIPPGLPDTVIVDMEKQNDCINKPLIILPYIILTIGFVACITMSVIIRIKMRSNEQVEQEEDLRLLTSKKDVLGIVKRKHKIQKGKIQMDEKPVANGNFSEVYLGTLRQNGLLSIRSCQGKRADLTVALKILKDATDDHHLQQLKNEINTFQIICQDQDRHPNIVKFFGVADIQRLQHLVIITEFCSVDGKDKASSLDSYLQENSYTFGTQINSEGKFCRSNPPPQRIGYEFTPTVTTSDLINWCLDIARGMHFLWEKYQIVHRDLAARNIVLDADQNNSKVAKIIDLGLCKCIRNNTGHNAGQIHYDFSFTDDAISFGPIQWLSPEARNRRIYSNDSDIWAYGVLLWEIFSLGERPYDKTPGEIIAFLAEGNRLEKPEYCNAEIYQIMLDCWKIDPRERPRFSKLIERFTRLKDQINKS